MTGFIFDSLVSKMLAAAATEDPAAAAARKLTIDAFHEPSETSAAMPDLESAEEIFFEEDSVSIWFAGFMRGIHEPPHDL